MPKYNPADVELALRKANSRAPFPSAADRGAWEKVREKMGKELVKELVAYAQDLLQESIPFLPASLYLECQRTGQREGYERPWRKRREMLAVWALAECLEYQGRFLDPLLNVIWAICEESSWVYPAHHPSLPDVNVPCIDLGVARTALDLAEVSVLLGRELGSVVERRIRWELSRRCFDPYLSRHDYWWLYNTRERRVNNWNAVCNAGILGAGLYLDEDQAHLAEIVARGISSLQDYLATFDVDGGSSEGPGYWAYGFGYYVVVAHLIEHYTAGQVKMLAGKRISEIARFPLRTVLSPGYYVNFSDCDPQLVFPPALLSFLAKRLQIPDLLALALMQLVDIEPTERLNYWNLASLTWGLRSLFWCPSMSVEKETSFTPAPHDWFRGMQWMIARYDPQDPEGLVLAAKGGHNDEMHNQNDVGNIIVHLRRESVIADIGRGRYTLDYFGPQRYKHLANSSLGHSVPVVNGFEQLPGREYRARLLDHVATDRVDILSLELKEAYPREAGVQTLQRTVSLHREPPHGWVELVDKVAFSQAPGDLQSVLTTFGQVEMDSNYLLIRGQRATLRVRFDPKIVKPRVEVVRNVDLAIGPRDVRRVIFPFKVPRKEGQIRLLIEPVGEG
ncbi:MAG: heparinase II/III family protein [Anaerolineae bacterium]|nr:heparinase II/III family protein [Anaerolineae bacterium]